MAPTPTARPVPPHSLHTEVRSGTAGARHQEELSIVGRQPDAEIALQLGDIRFGERRIQLIVVTRILALLAAWTIPQDGKSRSDLRPIDL